MKTPYAISFLPKNSAFALFLALVCLLPTLALGQDKVAVTVSILPQVWFVEEIGGDRVIVEALVGPGHSPATFEPTTKQMVRLQASQAFFSAGVPFERGLLPRIAANSDAPPVFGPRPAASAHHGHDHGHGHDHSDGLDPHTWLDPLQAMAMADTMGRVLAELSPEQAAYFSTRTAQLKLKLQELHQEVAHILAPVQGKTFYVFHPAYGHFAKAYGLHQVAVEDDGHEPGPRQLARVIDQINADNGQAILVQPQFSKKSSLAIARATNAEVLVLDPLAHQYDENLRHIATTLAGTLSGTKP